MFASPVPVVHPAELTARQAGGWMLLDVREPDEWAAGRIPGSTHIPMAEILTRMDEVGDRVVCICAVGARSARVTQYLNAQGRDAVNLDGGIAAWAAEGRPLER